MEHGDWLLERCVRNFLVVVGLLVCVGAWRMVVSRVWPLIYSTSHPGTIVWITQRMRKTNWDLIELGKERTESGQQNIRANVWRLKTPKKEF